MNATTHTAEDVRLAAREHVLRTLALAASDPVSGRFGRLLRADLREIAVAAARYLAADPELRPARLAPGEEPPDTLDLARLFDALDRPGGDLPGDHARVFGLVVSKECPPYEVQYCPQTFSVYRSQRLADVAGFYRAFGLRPGRDAPERADHLACELEFLAWLVAKERAARVRSVEPWPERAAVARAAQRSFLEDHVAWWVPAFARALRERASSIEPASPFHAALSSALAALVPIERAALDVGPPQELARPRAQHDAEEGSCAGCVSSAPA